MPAPSPLHVLWRSSVGADAAARTAADGRLPDGIELRIETDPTAALAHRDWFEVLVDGNPSDALLAAPRLRHLIIPYAGVGAELRQRLEERLRAGAELTVSNSHFNAGFVAQHAVALLLACSNRIVPADQALRRGDWRPGRDDAFGSRSLAGGTCLLAGYGAIGRAIEPMVRGLGMRVTALRRRPSRTNIAVYGPDQLHEALAEADAVIISLPATPATDGLFDERALAAMKDRAVLVNVGRGAVIDPAALYRALQSGRLFGAGLDVWWRYPESPEERAATLPAEQPFHELDNVVMSPHRAHQTEGWQDACAADVFATIAASVRGEVRNPVDLEVGY